MPKPLPRNTGHQARTRGCAAGGRGHPSGRTAHHGRAGRGIHAPREVCSAHSSHRPAQQWAGRGHGVPGCTGWSMRAVCAGGFRHGDHWRPRRSRGPGAGSRHRDRLLRRHLRRSRLSARAVRQRIRGHAHRGGRTVPGRTAPPRRHGNHQPLPRGGTSSFGVMECSRADPARTGELNARHSGARAGRTTSDSSRRGEDGRRRCDDRFEPPDPRRRASGERKDGFDALSGGGRGHRQALRQAGDHGPAVTTHGVPAGGA